VGTPGGGSGNFQSWARTISLHGWSTSGATSDGGPIEEEEEEEEEQEQEKKKKKTKNGKAIPLQALTVSGG
jgi:hypothetical protein